MSNVRFAAVVVMFWASSVSDSAGRPQPTCIPTA